MSISTSETDADTGELVAPTIIAIDGDGQIGRRIRLYTENTNNVPLTNYYIRSSVVSKVITETDGTGKKLKTFVPANGATIAEQQIVTLNNASTENLYFTHQDASGGSVQQTRANGDPVQTYTRTGEYDALGRNVADAGNFITLNNNESSTCFSRLINKYCSFNQKEWK